ncbi:MAG: hypothetical protein HOW73_22545 [Polyangiaceae bacterium]|nr:hypothetical protein [Polyangiaceae bacterium]
MALSACEKSDLWATITRNGLHTEITITNGYVGSSYVYANDTNALAGVATFQDFGVPACDSDGKPSNCVPGGDPGLTTAGATVERGLRCVLCGNPEFEPPEVRRCDDREVTPTR